MYTLKIKFDTKIKLFVKFVEKKKKPTWTQRLGTCFKFFISVADWYQTNIRFSFSILFLSLFVSISQKVGSEISSLISSSVYRSCMQTRTQRHLRKSSPHTPRKRMTSSPTSSLPTPCTLEQLGREWGHLRRRGPAPSDSLPHSLLLWWHFEPNYQHLTRLLQWHKRKPNWDLMNAFAVY